MAVLDELERVKQQIARRLRELEPLVSEYNELQQAADRLGVSVADRRAPRWSGRRSRAAAGAAAGTTSAAGGAKATRASSRRSSGGRAARRRRNAAAPGSRQQDVLRLVNERPGISVPELAKELGMTRLGFIRSSAGLRAAARSARTAASYNRSRRVLRTRRAWREEAHRGCHAIHLPMCGQSARKTVRPRDHQRVSIAPAGLTAR
jgi:hypothetical protein